MGALLAIAVAAAYLAAVHWLVRHAPGLWMRLLVVLAAIPIPSADTIYGRLKLREFCAEEGGMKIFRTVRNVLTACRRNEADAPSAHATGNPILM